MSIYEPIAKVASGLIEAMKTSPGLLTLMVLQILIISLLYVRESARDTRTFEREMIMLNQCLKK